MRTPFFLAIILLASCVSTNESRESSIFKPGPWLIELEVAGEILPFNFTHELDGDHSVLIIQNGDEKIVVREFVRRKDSLFFTVPVFGTSFSGVFMSDTVITGFWKNPSRGDDYKIAFTGRYGKTERFQTAPSTKVADFGGKWEVKFSPDSDDFCNAVGIFKQEGSKITGTFLTEMGDYRFLDGVVNGDKMMLSCFDGTHAFLFHGELSGSGEINGVFWSGTHWKEPWVGRRNEYAELTHPDSLTTVVGKYEPENMVFRNVDGNEIRLSENQFADKVLIIQIMGSWCPNCADECVDFSEFYSRYKEEGLEILAVAYEKSDDPVVRKKRLMKFMGDLRVTYSYVVGSGAGKSGASDDFPFLSEVYSFPTAIFIDSKGGIRKVHSGYYGPGTGSYHMKYKESCELLLEKLLREKSAVDLGDPVAVTASLK